MNRYEEIAPEIENLIDATDLETVLESIAYICREKAEHLRVNWQDKTSARVWDKDAKAIDSCIAKLIKH